MPKVFYTEKDIEDMVKTGKTSLEINDNVVLTDLAYEKANRLGLKLARSQPDNPPSAPVRPYLAQKQAGAAVSGVTSVVPAPRADGMDLHQRVKSAVVAKLGNQVDANLLDVIIQRVLASTGMK